MTKMSTCRCGQNMLWVKTATGKDMPVNYDPAIVGEKVFDRTKMTSHFATCPFAKNFRKIKK